MRTLCIAGKNQIAVDVLRLARGRGAWRVVVLPNAGDDATDGWQPSLRKEAEEVGVRIVSLDELAADSNLCFLSVEYDRLIRPDRFATRRLFNIHFSLLPKYRGCHTAIWPILNGESEHGVTLHWIDAGMDTGPIIDQHRFDLRTLTARDAYFRCMAEGASLIDKWLDELVEGDPPAEPQNEAAASSYGRAALDFARKDLDPRGTVEQLQRAWRAFTFPEFQRPLLGGREVTALQVESLVSGRSPCGTLEMLGDGWHLLWASDGAVRIRF